MSDQLVGIVAYGGYVPATRLPLAMIHGGRVKEGGAEKAVAGFDEDAITMAVSAATNCLHGIDRTTIDGVYFATTTSPFREKLAAAFIAKPLVVVRIASRAAISIPSTLPVRCVREQVRCWQQLMRCRLMQTNRFWWLSRILDWQHHTHPSK